MNFESANIGQTLQVIKTTPSLKGFAVTIPYKEKIIPYLDYISEEAQKIGAVNSVKVEYTIAGPILTGYNTDILGYPDIPYTSFTFRYWRCSQSRPARTRLLGNRSTYSEPYSSFPF